MKRSNQQPMASIAAARAAVIIAVAAGVAAIVACPAGAGAQVQGTYRMYSAGIHEYNDDYSIEAGVVRDEITGVGFSYSREVEMTPGALEGELMSEEVSGAPGFDVVASGSMLSIYRGNSLKAKMFVNESLFVFDPTVPTHYTALIRAFGDAAPWSMSVVVPSRLDYWRIEIDRRPKAAIPSGDGTVPADVYRIRTENRVHVFVFMIDGLAAGIYCPATDRLFVEAKYPQLKGYMERMFRQAM